MLLITLWSASISLSLPSSLCQHMCLPFRVCISPLIYLCFSVSLSLSSSIPVLFPPWLTETPYLSFTIKTKWKSFSSPPLFWRLSQVLTIINFPMLSTPTDHIVYHRNYYTYCYRSFIIFSCILISIIHLELLHSKEILLL